MHSNIDFVMILCLFLAFLLWFVVYSSILCSTSIYVILKLHSNVNCIDCLFFQNHFALLFLLWIILDTVILRSTSIYVGSKLHNNINFLDDCFLKPRVFWFSFPIVVYVTSGYPAHDEYIRRFCFILLNDTRPFFLTIAFFSGKQSIETFEATRERNIVIRHVRSSSRAN